MLLTLAMMVKDEEATIAKTLLSAKPWVDRYVVLDTGSTDRTKEIVASTMEGVAGEIHDASFVDFATSRNVRLPDDDQYGRQDLPAPHRVKTLHGSRNR